tara:strand:- start:1159 stop:1395 length:237 start_codon:yes stop_codon:yes gene_type:complete
MEYHETPDYLIVNPLQIELSIYPRKKEKLYINSNKNKIRGNPLIEKRFNQKLNQIREIALLLDNVKKSINNRKLLLDV